MRSLITLSTISTVALRTATRTTAWAQAALLAAGLSLGVSQPLSAATCDQFGCATMHDVIPNFAGQPTIRSTASGAWSSASTWNLGRVPTSTDIVAITGGTVVTIDGITPTAAVIGVEPTGKLTFRTDIPTRLTVGTLQLLPQGALQIGTPGAPVLPTVTAEIVIADVPLDLTDDGVGTFDPRQFGTSLLSIDAKVSMFGAVKTPFVRLAQVPLVGATSLRLATPVSGWRPGDVLVLPDSRQVTDSQWDLYSFKGENPVISSVSTDGLTVYLQSALLYTHPGAKDGNDVLEFLPHVGNLTRNIVIRSANPNGTRGHTLYTERSEVDIQWVAYRNLGRATVDPIDSTTFDTSGHVLHMGTNHIGRYPFHFHHVIGPIATPASGYQFTVNGDVVDDDAPINRHKWAMTIHASHYGLISNNIVHNAGGWGIGTEDGTESYDEFTGNFIVKVRGEGGRELPEGGNGLWFRGPNNYVRDNVISNVRGNVRQQSHAIQYHLKYLGNICVPNFPGADPHTQCTTVNANALPLRELARNEMYGAFDVGLSIWWLGSDEYNSMNPPTTVIQDTRVWNVTLDGAYFYPLSKVTVDGFVARGDKAVLANPNEWVIGIHSGDYMMHNLTIRNADIQNMYIGVNTSPFVKGSEIIEDSYLRNVNNIAVNTIGSPGAMPVGSMMPAKQTIIRNVLFGQVSGTVGSAQNDIYMNYTTQAGSANLVKRDAVFVYSYNQVAGDDFQVFYNEQAAAYLMPQTSGNLVGSPVAGLTNAQNWSTYGVAIGGEVATNTTTRSRIRGLVRAGAPQLLPDAPTITGITATTTQLTVAFTPGAAGSTNLVNYEYSTNGGTTWVTRSPVSTATPIVIGSLNPGQSYSVKLRAVNGTGASVASTAVAASTQALAPVLLSSATASITTATTSTPVVFAATATGGSGSYEYRFDLYNSTTGTWTRLQNYASTASVTWTPSAAGTYWTQVWVRRVGSTATYDDWRNTPTVTVTAPVTATASLTAVTTSLTTATTATPIVFGASATGASAYEYRFAVYNSGTAAWTVIQNYASTSSVTWTPSAAGTYWVQVWVRAVGSTATWQDWRNGATITVTVPTPATAKIATVTTSLTSATTSTPVVFGASGTGGSGSYQYRFAIYNATTATWTVLQTYASTASVTWTPSAAGTYWVQVWVRNAGSTATWEDWRNGATVIVAGAATTPAAFSSVTASRTSATTITPVVFTAAATGGSGSYEYRFSLYNAGSATWTELQTYSAAASVTWTPSAAGTYWVQAWVRNVGSTAAWEDWRNSATVTVTGTTTTPAAFSSVTASRTAATTTTPVVFTAAATGGNGSFEYRFALYNAGTATWTTLQNYSTTASVTWTPSAAGTYWVQAWVRNVGSTAAWEDWRNSPTVTVTGTTTTPAAFSAVTASRTAATTSTPVVFTAAGTGGSGSYEYRFALYNAGTATWTTLQNYSTSASVTWTPATVGIYWVQAWVRNVGSTASWEDWRNSATVTVSAGTTSPAAILSFTTSKTTVTRSTPVLFTAAATGGSGSYEYRFAVYNAGTGAWTTLRNYSTTTNVTWAPVAAGTYWVQVWVRNVGSSAAWEDWRNSAVVTVTP